MPYEELSIEEELAEFENEWKDEETTDVESEESTKTVQEDGQEVEETDTNTEQHDPNASDVHERNQAFAAMRKQAEENQRYADLIKGIAQQAGVTPEDVIARYQQQQLEAEAENMDRVQVLKESRETREELNAMKSYMREQDFDNQLTQVTAKYGADDNSIRGAIDYMLRSGVDPRVQDNVNFEHFYRAANLDSIINKRVEEARQQDLDDKVKRQNSASIGNGTSVTPSSDGEMSDEEFNEILAKMDLRI